MKIASLRRRALAGLIDFGMLAIAVVVALAGLVKIGPTRRLATSRFRRLAEKTFDDWPGPEFFESTRFRRGIQAGSLVMVVAGRNWRGGGARVVGIRRVDERTGGPVTVRSAVVRYAVSTGGHLLRNRLFKPLYERARSGYRAVEPELRELREKYSDDPEALNRAAVQLYHERGINPARFWALVIPQVFLGAVPTLMSPRNQSISDRLAGLVVVDDDS